MAYTAFDTAIGRCGIAWSDLGIAGVQLPEAREIDTRRRMYRLYPEAREQRPPLNTEIAIEGIAALLRGGTSDFSEVALDVTGIPTFHQHVYRFVRGIPRGETRIYDEIAAGLHVPRAVHSVEQAIGRNPFMVIVPCHRVLEAGNRQDLAERGRHLQAAPALDRGCASDHEQDPVRSAAAARCTAPPA